MLPVRNVVLMNAADKRSLFAIPRGQVTFIGTTDTSYTGGARVWPEIDGDDVRYLLEPVSRYFAVPPIGPGDIVGAWAGLRPLVAQPGKAPVDLSRKDEVTIGSAGVVTVAGGKLTGYRPMAIRILETAASVLGGLPERPHEEPTLPGGDFDGDLGKLGADLAAASGVSGSAASRLVSLYGSEATRVLEMGRAPLVDGAGVFEGEVAWAVHNEGAQRVEDVLYRRTRVALYEPGERAALAQAMSRVMATALDWSPQRARDELERARAIMASEMEAFARNEE
jgi:glycerol-3-phosphate dehydrogenase